MHNSRTFQRNLPVVVAAFVFCVDAITSDVRSEEILYAYEGDVFPYDESAGWIQGDPCNGICSESLEGGHFVLAIPQATEMYSFVRWIAYPPQQQPETLWVEWQFRSNHPKPPHSYTCDGKFTVHYKDVHELVFMYGDWAISFSGSDWVSGLSMEEFHSFRFESLNGINFRVSVDGIVFIARADNDVDNGASFLRMAGMGGCGDDWIPNMRNEWDFVRYGTIGFGERIVAADPPIGFLYPGEHANLDRFTVTYDSPNYAYIDDIAVGVTCPTAPNCPEAPEVIATKRLDNGPPDVLEIVLDRPLPLNARTVFTFTDVDPANPTEPAINIVSYTFQLGDVDADGDWDLRDFSYLQNCFRCTECASIPGLHCTALDYFPLGIEPFIEAADFWGFSLGFTGPLL